jgi:hypothetical protein
MQGVLLQSELETQQSEGSGLFGMSTHTALSESQYEVWQVGKSGKHGVAQR